MSPALPAGERGPDIWIVTDGLMHASAADAPELHPALAPWRKALLRRAAQWHACPPRTALEWGALLACGEAAQAPAWLASAVAETQGGLPEEAAQCWLAAPFHAMLGRDSVRVMPEGLFDWDEADARALCDLLAPVLAPHGLRLLPCGAAMLAISRAPRDAAPPSFAAIGGGLLPDRHSPGADGGWLMRLMAEIQMYLHMNPLPGRQGRPGVTGVWLWGACPASRVSAMPAGMEGRRVVGIGTRNPALRALCDGRDARVLVSEADRLAGLVRADARPPALVVLAGAGRALVLRDALWRRAMPHRRLLPRPPGQALPVERLDARLRALAGGGA